MLFVNVPTTADCYCLILSWGVGSAQRSSVDNMQSSALTTRYELARVVFSAIPLSPI